MKITERRLRQLVKSANLFNFIFKAAYRLS